MERDLTATAKALESLKPTVIIDVHVNTVHPRERAETLEKDFLKLRCCIWCSWTQSRPVASLEGFSAISRISNLSTSAKHDDGACQKLDSVLKNCCSRDTGIYRSGESNQNFRTTSLQGSIATTGNLIDVIVVTSYLPFMCSRRSAAALDVTNNYPHWVVRIAC